MHGASRGWWVSRLMPGSRSTLRTSRSTVKPGRVGRRAWRDATNRPSGRRSTDDFWLLSESGPRAGARSPACPPRSGPVAGTRRGPWPSGRSNPRLQVVPASDVVLPLPPVVEVVSAVVLDGEPFVRVAQIGSGDPAAVGVMNVLVDPRLGSPPCPSSRRSRDSIGESTPALTSAATRRARAIPRRTRVESTARPSSSTDTRWRRTRPSRTPASGIVDMSREVDERGHRRGDQQALSLDRSDCPSLVSDDTITTHACGNLHVHGSHRAVVIDRQRPQNRPPSGS